VDIYRYYPGLPAASVRVEPDPAYHNALAVLLDDFCALLEVRKTRLIQRGWLKEKQPEVEDSLGVSDADVDAILEVR